LPFESNREVYAYYYGSTARPRGWLMDFWEETREVMMGLLEASPERRITAREAIESEWLRDG
jgi:hypothetical protein